MTPNPLVLWPQASARLQQLLSTEAFVRWIAPLQVVGQTEDSLTLGVANDFFQTWLQDNYLPLIRSAVLESAGRPVQIQFATLPTSEGNPADAPDLPPPTPSPSADRRDVCVELNPSYTFERFVVGPNNEFAHAAALAVSQSPGTAYNPLFIYGGTGLGKTHLTQAIGSSLIRSLRARRLLYVTAEAFVNEFIHTIQTKNFVRFRKKFRSTDVLIIDDVHFFVGKEQMQEEFFHTFNELHNSRKQIILSSDRPVTELKGLEARLVSRFEWSQVTEILPPDFETRVAILRKKSEAHGISVSDELLTFIAQHIRSNVRRLESALVRVSSFSSMLKRSPSLEDVEKLLHSELLEERRISATIPMIQQRVSAHFEILLSDMTSRRRPREVAFARQVAMFLCRRLTPSSLTEIGSSFGGRDHGTVIHACRLVQSRMSKDSGLRQTLAYLSKQLGQ